MKLRMASIVFLMGMFLVYLAVLVSSMRFENNKYEFNYSVLKNSQDNAIVLSFFESFKNSLTHYILQNPSESELLLRAQLIVSDGMNKQELAAMELSYLGLLAKRPTWPYYYSGLLRVQMFDFSLNFKTIRQAITYGAFEFKVAKSMAELLFYKWDYFSKDQQNSLLAYLSSQPRVTKTQIVAISAKFAKIYEYCDYIYEEKQLEYSPCKKYYWEPLL